VSLVDQEHGAAPHIGPFDLAHSGGLLYGAVVTAAVLVTVGGHDASVGYVVGAWVIVLGTYWMTHVYVVTWEAQFRGDSRHLGFRLLDGARTELTVLAGGLPAMVVFLVASATGLDAFEAERIALYSTVVLLAIVGFIGARRAGRGPAAAWMESLGAAALGLVMVAAKSQLH
jgi:hypothetical protein